MIEYLEMISLIIETRQISRPAKHENSFFLTGNENADTDPTSDPILDTNATTSRSSDVTSNETDVSNVPKLASLVERYTLTMCQQKSHDGRDCA